MLKNEPNNKQALELEKLINNALKKGEIRDTTAFQPEKNKQKNTFNGLFN